MDSSRIDDPVRTSPGGATPAGARRDQGESRTNGSTPKADTAAGRVTSVAGGSEPAAPGGSGGGGDGANEIVFSPRSAAAVALSSIIASTVAPATGNDHEGSVRTATGQQTLRSDFVPPRSETAHTVIPCARKRDAETSGRGNADTMLAALGSAGEETAVKRPTVSVDVAKAKQENRLPHPKKQTTIASGPMFAHPTPPAMQARTKTVAVPWPPQSRPPPYGAAWRSQHRCLPPYHLPLSSYQSNSSSSNSNKSSVPPRMMAPPPPPPFLQQHPGYNYRLPVGAKYRHRPPPPPPPPQKVAAGAASAVLSAHRHHQPQLSNQHHQLGQYRYPVPNNHNAAHLQVRRRVSSTNHCFFLLVPFLIFPYNYFV